MSNESTRDALYTRYVKFASSKGYVRTKTEYFERFETFKAHIITCLGTRQSPVNWKGLTKITGSVSTSSMLNAALLELIEEGEVTRLEQPDADDLFQLAYNKPSHAMNPCLQKAEPNEPIFVLLGRDPATPAAIYAWADKRVALGKNSWQDEQIKRAILLASQLEKRRYIPESQQ